MMYTVSMQMAVVAILAVASFVTLGLGASPARAQVVAQTGEIHGRVVDTSGGAIPGATIVVRPIAPLAGQSEVQLTSDANGAFRLTELAPGPYPVIARLTGFRTAATTVTVVPGKPIAVNLSLRIANIAHCINLGLSRTGSVRLRSGHLLVNATLVVTSPKKPPLKVEVDADGRFGQDGCLSVAIEDTVTFEAAGYSPVVVKPSGVDPNVMSWDLVLDVSAADVAEMARHYVPKAPDVTLWPGEVLVVIATTVGEFAVAVDTARAPTTSANFLKYVDAGLYDGGRFHRATRPDNYTLAPPNRPMMEIIQGGINPARRQDGFLAIPLERTSVTGIRHAAGVVSMWPCPSVHRFIGSWFRGAVPGSRVRGPVCLVHEVRP